MILDCFLISSHARDSCCPRHLTSNLNLLSAFSASQDGLISGLFLNLKTCCCIADGFRHTPLVRALESEARVASWGGKHRAPEESVHHAQGGQADELYDDVGNDPQDCRNWVVGIE